MNKAKQDSLLGVVFFVGLALLLWATYALTDLSFEEKPTIEVFCDNAGTLRQGDPVFVLGNRMGQVQKIDYVPNASDPNSRMKLILELKSDLVLARDAKIDITAANLLGGKVIEIDPGIAAEVWPANLPYQAKLKASGLDAIGELLDDPKLQDDFKETVAGIRTAVDKLNTTDGTLGLLINSDGLYNEFNAAVASARKSLEELEKQQSPLGRLIYSDEDGQKLSDAITRIESVATKIDEGEGLVGRIINDVELGNDAKQLVTDVKDIVADAKAGKGTIGALLRDDGLADKVEKMIDGFSEFATNATDPEAGLVGALVSDPTLREKGSKFISDLEAIGDELRNGKGTLARLINDEDMGEQLNRILNQVSRAIEDAREAAPIGTFFQVLSGAF